jgi:hypothetical protein
MNNPKYRLATVCPRGMSPELKAYLNKSTPDGGLMKHYIAQELIDPLRSSKPALAGSAVGLAAAEYTPDALMEWMNSLSSI